MRIIHDWHHHIVLQFWIKLKLYMKKINKKYVEIMCQADNEVGRKEVVSLLKKAAIIISKSEENLVA